MNTYKPLLFSALLIALLLVFSPAFAKQKEEFDLKIVPTVDQRLDSWLKIPAELKPTIHMPEKIYPNQPFALRILFKGYSLSDDNIADITYDVQFYDPTGKPTADQGKNLLGYNNKIRNENAIIINQQLLRVFFDESYPFGEYEIKIVARDHVAKKTISRSDKIEFAPFERIANFVSYDFYTYWVKTYFRQPDVAKALFGYMQFFTDSPEWLQNNMQLTGFANQLLQDNPWIWGHLVSLYQEQPEERDKIIALMALGNQSIPGIATTFTDKQKNDFERLQQTLTFHQGQDVVSGNQIAWLWGHFYATGHLEPVEKIVRSLKPFALSDPPEENYKAKTPEEIAFWSLINNGQEISLAISYYTYLVDYGKISAGNKIQLRLVLNVIEKALKEKAKEKEDSATDINNGS